MKINALFLRSLALLFVFFLLSRIGSHTPIPFINPMHFDELFSGKSNSALDLFNVMTGGALSRMSVFTLGLMPYISASLVIILFKFVSTTFSDKLNENGGSIITEKYKRILTVLFVGVQSIALSNYLLSQSIATFPLVSSDIPAIVFHITTFAALLAGTFSSVWIANTITFIGFGSGISMLIMFNIMAAIPSNIMTIHSMYDSAIITVFDVSMVIVALGVAYFLTIVFENTERRIKIVKPNGVMGVHYSFQSLKANPVGIMPPVFAAVILSIPAQVIGVVAGLFPQVAVVGDWFAHGTTTYYVIFAALLFIFGFVMAELMAPHSKLSETFRVNGYMIPTIKAGKDTDAYLKRVSTALVWIGCFYLLVICLIPEYVNYSMEIPLYMGGTAIMIMVSCMVDFKRHAAEMLKGNSNQKLADEFSKAL